MPILSLMKLNLNGSVYHQKERPIIVIGLRYLIIDYFPGVFGSKPHVCSIKSIIFCRVSLFPSALTV